MPNAPRRNGRDLWGYAPACCRRLHESVPSSTLAVRRLYVTKDGSPTHRPALQWSFHATPHARGRLLRQWRLRPCRRVLSLPVSGRRPVKPSRGDAESAMSPFGSGRPVRPCVVVNPGGGWASWPQPSSENNFPCFVTAFGAFLAGQILFASRFSTVLRPLRGAASPSPAGRITTRTHWRDLVQPERRNHHG